MCDITKGMRAHHWFLTIQLLIKATLLTLIMTSLININLSNTQHAIIKRSFYIEKALITHSLKVHRVNSRHSLLKHQILILES